MACFCGGTVDVVEEDEGECDVFVRVAFGTKAGVAPSGFGISGGEETPGGEDAVVCG